MKGNSCTARIRVHSEVRFLPSHRDEEIGGLTSLMITFQRDGSLALEKNSPSCKTGERIFFFFNLHLKVEEKEFAITSFLK